MKLGVVWLLKRQQQELEDLRKENEELRQVSEYETELERQLQERDTHATQLKGELERLRRLSQVGNHQSDLQCIQALHFYHTE